MKLLVDLSLEVDVPDGLPRADESAAKDWLWAERRDELLRALRVRPVPDEGAAAAAAPPEAAGAEPESSYDASKRLIMLDIISRAQRQHLMRQEARTVFGALLASLLELMSSEYGFIGEIQHEEDGTVYLQTHAITNIAWNAETRALYDRNIAPGLRFYNLKSLFGNVMTTKEVVISNNPKDDPRACGIPKGHPALNAFLGVPFFDQGCETMIGMVGIANKAGGYSQEDVAFIEPFINTCSNLIQAYNALNENKMLINTLEEKVAERTRELSLANGSLEAANQRVVAASAAQLTHFACMSHEIRTPLNCIIGLSSLLHEMDLSEKQRDAIRMIITSGELLCAVVNDILDFSKLESGNVVIEIRPTSLQETLDSVVNSIEHKAKAKQLKFRTNYSPALPHCIETDGNRLQQILYNLLGNATKFSETGGSIELSVDYEDTAVDHIATPAEQGQVEPTAVVGTTSNQSNGVLRFSVKDYGTGIDSKDFLRIFEPFRQANGDTERLYGGTGLGLAITSRLVERLGGEISVDSEVGRWSKFTVSLPVTTISLFERTSAVRQLADAHILYVDEPNEPNCRVLGSLGVSMDRFSTSQELLDWFLSHKRSRDHHFYFCLVHEDLFSPDIHRKISEVAPNALVTFGPQLSQFAESHAHYRTLSGRIPSVLLKSLADLRDDVVDPTSRARNTVKLQPLDIVKRIDVLIAEDNVINQKVLCKMLNRVGVEHIDIANNGREAVEMATQKNYDIIFMDMQMPIMCGDEACRIILDRCKARDRRPKIAFVSAHASTNFELQAAAAGADGFMSKPFNVKKFEDFVRTLNIHTSAPLST